MAMVAYGLAPLGTKASADAAMAMYMSCTCS